MASNCQELDSRQGTPAKVKIPSAQHVAENNRFGFKINWPEKAVKNDGFGQGE